MGYRGGSIGKEPSTKIGVLRDDQGVPCVQRGTQSGDREGGCLEDFMKGRAGSWDEMDVYGDGEERGA